MRYLSALILCIILTPTFAASSVWQISDGARKLFLAGTVHILRPQDFPLPSAYDQAYAAAEQLVFEVDIAQTQGIEFQRSMLAAMLLPQGESLKDHLREDTWQRLSEHLLAQGIPVAQFNGFKPSMVALTLTIVELKKLGVGEGVDTHYHQRALKDGKPVAGLETVQQQLEFITSMGEGAEDEMIEQTLHEITTLGEDFDEMAQSWRNGDTAGLHELFVTPMQRDFPAIYQQLLVQRNLNWMPKIDNYLATPETELIMVGSAHLVGEDGLIHKLRKAGYKVRQLD